MLHSFPVIANYLLALLCNVVLVFPSAYVAVERAILHPGCLEKWCLRACGGNQYVRFFHSCFAVAPGGMKTHIGKDSVHLRDKLIFVNRLGVKVLEIDCQQLAELLARGLVSIVDTGEKFDNTLERVVRSIQEDRKS